MGKKATISSTRAESLRVVKARGEAQQRPRSQESVEDPFVGDLLSKVHSSCSSESDAISVLISNVLENLGERPAHRAEMAEFLQTLIDTDPDLRRDIVSGLQLRK